MVVSTIDVHAVNGQERPACLACDVRIQLFFWLLVCCMWSAIYTCYRAVSLLFQSARHVNKPAIATSQCNYVRKDHFAWSKSAAMHAGSMKVGAQTFFCKSLRYGSTTPYPRDTIKISVRETVFLMQPISTAHKVGSMGRCPDTLKLT